MININTTTIQKIKESIDRTNERAESEGFTDTDETMDCLSEFCDFLLADSADPGALERFLTGQDMVVPD